MTMKHRYTPKLILAGLVVTGVLSVTALVAGFYPASHQATAACSAPATAYGSGSASVTIQTAGTYTIWSRIKVPDTTNNSYFLEIDGGTCVAVGKSAAIPVNTWTWVNYQNGSTTTPTTATLTAGSHTFKLVGTAPNVALDRVILTTDAGCIPTGTGDNCIPLPDTTAPTASLTAPLSGSTVKGTINLNATASDNTGGSGVAKVEFYVDGALKGTDSTPPSPFVYALNTTTLQDGNHTLNVKAYDAANNPSPLSTAVTIVVKNADTSAPTSPSNLTSPSQTTSSVALSWAASTDDIGVTGYRVYRNGVQVGTPTSTTYTDSGLTASTAYSYRVAAVDAAGNVSTQSSALSASTKAAPDTTAPSAPANLTTSSLTSSAVTLTWAASTDNVGVVKYLLQRGGVTIAQPTTTSYRDSTLVAGTAYSYRVLAVDAAGNVSPASNTASVTAPQPPDTTPPSVPTGLAGVPASQNQVNLSWNASTDNVGVAHYRISRNGVQVGTSQTMSFGDTGLTANTAYQYTVAAVDGAGNVSTASAAITVTTLPTPPVAETTGIWAEYFNNTGLSGAPTVARQESQINHNWDRAAPTAGIGADNFSVRWTGRLKVPTSGNYTLYVKADDGVRLWINDELVINDWTTHAAKELKVTKYLDTTSIYNIRLEYFEQTGRASAVMSWSGPSLAKQVIPNKNLDPQRYGLTASYYDNQDLTGYVTSRLDKTLDHDWVLGAPVEGIGSDDFSVRWTGRLYAPVSGTYTISTKSDDGVRLRLGGQLLIDDWQDYAVKQNIAQVTLVGGQTYPISLEYYENLGYSSVQLLWTGPTAPDQEIIPQQYLRSRY